LLQNQVVKHINSIKTELQAENRSKNMVIFGLPQDDKPVNDVVSDLFSECSLSFEKYGPSCIALGSRQGTKPRPIKVTFQTEADKWEALKVINREKPTGVFARLDLNREEQEQDFRLRQELKKVRAENPEGTYKIYKGKITQVEN
jgi:hypothetical protein